MDLLSIQCIILLLYTAYLLLKKVIQKSDQCCYLLHYQCYKPPEDQRLDTQTCSNVIWKNENLGIDEYRYLLQMIINSGIGEGTYGPKNFLEGRERSPTINDGIIELDDMMFDTLDRLFDKTGISPQDIDILVVNVSLWASVPSLTSRIVNRYKMRPDIKTFNITGMGCSASIIAVDLLRNLFKVHKNSFAVVVSSESLSPHWYCGKDRSFMLSNMLFRTGGCSMLYTNRRDLKHRAMLKLKETVRIHMGSNDDSYKCCYQIEDGDGNSGFRLSKDLVKVAAKSLKVNLRVLVPKIIPITELIRFFLATTVVRKFRKSNPDKVGGAVGLNFKTGIQHFCIHPGGRAVIDGVGKGLGLNSYDLEPARMALYRWGNTSAGGFWYCLGYMEAKKRLKKGDKILMTSFGAGFKCNTCVWEVMRDLKDRNVWDECIDSYPPPSIENPFKKKFEWINDEVLNFVRLR